MTTYRQGGIDPIMVPITLRTNTALPPALELATEAFDKVAHFERFYPAFEDWYWRTVVPGLTDGSRSIHCVRRDGDLAGFCILKHAEERKICTLWVADRFIGTGMGVRLLTSCAQQLGGSPLATVPDERYPLLGPVLSSLGFRLTEVLEGYYRPGHKEYVFNGHLRDRTC